MTPTGFMNGQDELRCYVNSSFQVLFFNIFFRTLIMNIDCKKNMENMDNSTDDYRGYIQKMMILQEMLIGGRKIVNRDTFFDVTNIMKMSKMILQSLKGYFTKWCQRNPL